MKNPQIAVSMMAPSQLLPNPWNTNTLTAEAEEKLDKSLQRLGMFKPVVVRVLETGEFQILGGEHRWESAKRLKMTEIPVVNLGRISENKAKEIGLVDNARYGADDTLQLAELLEGLGLSTEEMASFMPYSETDLASIFSSVNIDLDDLDIPDSDEKTPAPSTPAPQTHVVMRFKIPIDDSGDLTALIEKTMKEQRFTEEDSLSNAGNALVHLLLKKETE